MLTETALLRKESLNTAHFKKLLTKQKHDEILSMKVCQITPTARRKENEYVCQLGIFRLTGYWYVSKLRDRLPLFLLCRLM